MKKDQFGDGTVDPQGRSGGVEEYAVDALGLMPLSRTSDQYVELFGVAVIARRSHGPRQVNDQDDEMPGRVLGAYMPDGQN